MGRRGYPTRGVRGIMFRSRTEARWSAFLESLGVEWSYEPVTFDKYLPDFAVEFGKKTFFIEIKCLTNRIQLAEHIAKSKEALEEEPFAVCGASCFREDDGFIVGIDASGKNVVLVTCGAGECCNGGVSFAIEGACVGCGGATEPVDSTDADLLWNECLNETQWKGRKRKLKLKKK